MVGDHWAFRRSRTSGAKAAAPCPPSPESLPTPAARKRFGRFDWATDVHCFETFCSRTVRAAANPVRSGNSPSVIGSTNPKSEVRNPKEIRIPKSEKLVARMTAWFENSALPGKVRISGFGFLSDFGFRASNLSDHQTADFTEACHPPQLVPFRWTLRLPTSVSCNRTPACYCAKHW